MRLVGISSALFLVLMPGATVFIHEVGGHDGARIAQLALSLMCALVLMLRPPTLAKWSVQAKFIIALAVLLALVSIARAPDRIHATRELALWLGLIPIAWALAGLLQVRPEAGFLVSASATTIYATLVLMLALSALAANGPAAYAELFVGYDNRRFFNHVQTVALPLTVTAALVAENPRLRALAWIGAIGSTSLLLASGGRATMLALLVGVACAVLISRREGLPAAKGFGLMLMAGAAVYAVVFILLPAVLGVAVTSPQEYRVERLSSDQSRGQLWGAAVAQIREAPWFGIGPMHYARGPNLKAAHPHNVYLQVAAEWGVPMFLLLTGLAGRALAGLCRAIRQCPPGSQRRIGIGLLITWIAIAVDGAMSGNFVMPVSQVWIAFAAGWTWSWWLHNAPPPRVLLESGSPMALRRAAFLALFLLQFWLCWDVWPEVVDLPSHVAKTMATAPNAGANPRFWSHGWF